MSCHSGRQSISQEAGTQFSKMQQTAAKWIWSTDHFSKSCPQYLWVCQVTQAGMEPVAAPAAVQMVGELPTMWQGGQQDTQLTPSWSVLHTSGNKMLAWAYPEHANNIWVCLGGEQGCPEAEAVPALSTELWGCDGHPHTFCLLPPDSPEIWLLFNKENESPRCFAWERDT